jgi:membrane protein DedA with SNARE-associated domain
MTWGKATMIHAAVLAVGAQPGVGGGGGLVGVATRLMNDLGDTYGGPGAAVANGLDSIIPFIPSEVILPLAGVFAGQGHMSLAAAIIWTTLGSMAGSLVMYGIGLALGRERTRALVARIPLIEVEEVERTEAWFTRHGGKAVFFGRFLPLFRSLISIPAGIERMPVLTFLALTTAGSVIWNAAFVCAGYALGQNWEVVERYAGLVTDGVVVVVVLVVGYFVLSRVRRARAGRASAATAAEPESGAADRGPSR